MCAKETNQCTWVLLLRPVQTLKNCSGFRIVRIADVQIKPEPPSTLLVGVRFGVLNESGWFWWIIVKFVDNVEAVAINSDITFSFFYYDSQ